MKSASITSKRQMYALLAAGRFGNCVPHYATIEAWERDNPDRHNTQWAIRDVRPSGRFITAASASQVYSEITASNYPDGYYILAGGTDLHSPRIANIELQEQWDGLYVWASTYPATLRESLERGGKHYHRSAAHAVLRHYVTGADYEDLRELMAAYSEHVIELTTFDNYLGTIPGRKVVIWEVRMY